MYVNDETTPVNFPISTPVNIGFKIIHVMY